LPGSLITDWVIPSDCCIKPSSAPYASRTYADYVDNNGDDDADAALHAEIATFRMLSENKACRVVCQ
ncbi:MAG: hypothetical protein KBH73_11150, partial [Syntrophobacterales bacterium]|nr:hypothetical protein [Syntrophobacterales bacterium]